jgi:maltose O-acetyltransferase
MRAGELYDCPDAHLLELQDAARRKLDAFNSTPLSDLARRQEMLADMLGHAGRAMVLSPVTWEYGRHIHIGDNVFINFDCVFLDGADIVIGDNTAIGPRVQFLTVGHPVDPAARTRLDPATGQPFGAYASNKPITIGRDCWIGAGAIILGGVTIGDGTTIGAGSVVTRDVPAGMIAAGNPCRGIRPVASPAVWAAKAG